MQEFKSDEELFQAIRVLAERFEKQKHSSAANSLLNGLKGINGLTDGWAILMESIDEAIQKNSQLLESSDLLSLKEILAIIKKLVYRS